MNPDDLFDYHEDKMKNNPYYPVKPEDYDKEYLKGKGCSHLFKKIKTKEGEEPRYVCDNCGCKTNFKPNFWPSVDDIHDSKK